MNKLLGTTVAVLVLSTTAVSCTTGPRQPGQTTTTLPGGGERPVTVVEPGGGARGPSSVGGQVHHKVVGRVTDINRNAGQVTISTPEGGSMKLVLPPLAVATIREGDDVAVDVIVTPRR
jgi:hypothetical protein